MGNYQHSMNDMRADVKAYIAKRKSIKRICEERGICRKTFDNWKHLFQKKESNLFKNNEKVNKAMREKSQTSENENFMLKSAVSKIVPVAIQRKLVQNIVRRFSVTVEEACETVGFDFEEYGYRPRVQEMDDQEVIKCFKDILTENPNISLYGCFVGIQIIYPDCPSKQMKRICKEYKPTFDAHRNKVKSEMRRIEKNKQET